ncbi:MAG: hypothetical protein ABI721_04270 [Candidatus Dojkabacteria bacterium]
MHKNKDGKVTASLTEVKNRTGDIFALVDEFGEVYLTSYNKVRYKITKTDIADYIDLKDSPTKTEKKEVKKVIKQDKSITQEELRPKVVTEGSAVNNVLSKISKVLPWDRDNKMERKFADNARSPLVSN